MKCKSEQDNVKSVNKKIDKNKRLKKSANSEQEYSDMLLDFIRDEFKEIKQ